MTLVDIRDLASILGVIVAVAVYVTNSYYQVRQRKIDNAMRFYEAHHRLFENKFLSPENIRKMEKGILQRDKNNEQMEQNFNRLLAEVEHIALLQKTRAISKSINIYMFGWFAQKIQPLLTNEERNNVYWELAVEFLDEMKAAADDFYKKTKEERVKYFNKNHFLH